MTQDRPAPSAPPSPSQALDASVALCERQARFLAEMAEVGMGLIRSLAAPEAGAGDAADAFARLTRALRLTFALESKLDERLRDLRDGVVRGREADELELNKRGWGPHEERGEVLIERVGDVGKLECESERDYGELLDAISERLGNDEAYADLASRPIREMVERLCKDLTLTPDWSLWDEDRQDWREGAIPLRPRSCAFNTPSAKPRWPRDRWSPGAKPNPPFDLHAPKAPGAHPLE